MLALGDGDLVAIAIELVFGVIVTVVLVYLLSIVFSITYVPTSSPFYSSQQTLIWGASAK